MDPKVGLSKTNPMPMTKNDPQLLTMFTHHTKTVRGHLMNSTEKFKTLGAWMAKIPQLHQDVL